jgi:hypothetical protein
MATPAVGQDIDALCGKCGQVWHVVMAKMGDRIAKVVCKRCGGQHRYRSENGVEAPREARRTPSPSAAARRTAAALATEGTPRAIPAFDPSKPVLPYAATARYAAGDRISHPRFGVGVVAGSPGAGKVEVVFPSGIRVLACAKAASTLARPVAALDSPISDRPPK